MPRFPLPRPTDRATASCSVSVRHRCGQGTTRRPPGAVSLNALTRYDHDIGVIGEQCQSSVEVLRREAAAELVDRCENAFDIGHTSHRLDNRSNKEHREAGECWRHHGVTAR